jgi:hypothetical protein
MKNALCGLSRRVVTLSSTSNAIFDPIRTEGLFFTRDFCAELHGLSFNRSRRRSHRCVLCEKSCFSQFFTSFFYCGPACRPRRDHRTAYSSSVNFFLNFKQLHSSSGARIAQKSRKKLKSFILLWNQFRYYVIVRHANHCYGLTAVWLRPLGLNDAA